MGDLFGKLSRDEGAKPPSAETGARVPTTALHLAVRREETLVCRECIRYVKSFQHSPPVPVKMLSVVLIELDSFIQSLRKLRRTIHITYEILHEQNNVRTCQVRN